MRIKAIPLSTLLLEHIRRLLEHKKLPFMIRLIRFLILELPHLVRPIRILILAIDDRFRRDVHAFAFIGNFIGLRDVFEFLLPLG